MSVVIRMQRAGGRNFPFFRVVVADSRRARDGRFLEKLGHYNPLAKTAQFQVDQERVRFWIDRGALPSESVSVLLKRSGGAAAPAAPVAAAAVGAGKPAASVPEAPAVSTTAASVPEAPAAPTTAASVPETPAAPTTGASEPGEAGSTPAGEES